MLTGIKKILAIWRKAGAGSHAAATAYYAIFSLAPLVLIAVTVAGIFLGRDTAQSAILDQFGTTFGTDFRGFAESLIAPPSGGESVIATIISSLLIVLGASGIFGALREGLDEVFENLPRDKKPGFISGIIDQLISVGMVLSLGFLLLASLLVSTVLTGFGDYLRGMLPGAQLVAAIADFLLSYLLISGFLAVLIGFLPSKKVGRGPALAGGLIAGAVFIIGKYAIALYFAIAHPASAFGAASAMVVVVLWTYYLALGLFFSAILARVLFASSTQSDPA